jgi:hypothetical protein
MRIAIGYHGLVRGYKYKHVSLSHETVLIKPLQESGHIVDIYVHTFDKEFDSSIYDSNPKKIVIESDNALTDSLTWINKYRFPAYFPDELCINYFKDMYTRKQVYHMIETSDVSYDWIFMLNPGQLLQRTLPPLNLLNPLNIYIPNHSHNGGYNGRFALGGMKPMAIYSSLFDVLFENREHPLYMSNPQQDVHNQKGAVNIHPETSIKYILNKHGYFPVEQHHLLLIEAIRVRTDGSVS